jgi:small multidrug resistance family-3 protein
MKILAFVLAATIFEAFGDAVIRLSLHGASLPARIGLFIAGSALLTLYGTSLNLAPVDFTAVTGLYLATLVVAFQAANYVFFHAVPTLPVLGGCVLVISGGLVIYFCG